MTVTDYRSTSLTRYSTQAHSPTDSSYQMHQSVGDVYTEFSTYLSPTESDNSFEPAHVVSHGKHIPEESQVS